MTDIGDFLRARRDDDGETLATLDSTALNGIESTAGWSIRQYVERRRREVEAKRLLIDEHLPQWRTVEWDHDQNGKGEALCCPRCQNAEHSEWNPPSGQATGLPEGFVTPYVLAPCMTLLLLAAPFDQHPDFREEWRVDQ